MQIRGRPARVLKAILDIHSITENKAPRTSGMVKTLITLQAFE